MANVATLDLKIDSRSAKIANKRLKELEKRGGKTEKATGGLMAGFKKLAVPLGVVTGLMGSLTKITSVTREFDVLNAQLITATGSVEDAGVAFDAIQEFAERTPYDLAQVTTGFVKLVNLGLTPSERALESYGNTAASLGGDLNQMVEAVADAAVGEFERLKEFGIAAKSEGENVSFTFRGITETVKKEAGAIEEYMIALGENNFAGAMANRMNTLDGAMSNLGDSWNKLWLEISQQGVGNMIQDGVRLAIDAINWFTDLVSSGLFSSLISDIITPFTTLFNFIATGWMEIGNLFGDSATDWKGIFTTFFDFIRFGFAYLPAIVKSEVKNMAIYLGSLIETAKAIATNIADTFSDRFAMMVEIAKTTGIAMGHALNPFDGGDFNLTAELLEIDNKYAQMAKNRQGESEQRRADILAEKLAKNKAVSEELFAVIDAGEKEHDAKVANFEKLRDLRATPQGEGEDRLAKFGIGAPSSSEDEDDALTQQQARQQKSFDSLQESLMTENEAVIKAYNDKLLIIEEAEGATAEAKLDAKTRLDEQYFEAIMNSNALEQETELEAIDRMYQERNDLIMAHTFETENERTTMMMKSASERHKQLQAFERAQAAMVITEAGNIAESLLSISEDVSGKHTDFYRGMFLVTKAFSIAEATMNIATAISAAAAAGPFPANLAAIASTVSATAGLVSTIKGASMDISGLYDNGGQIPSGKVGIVGEYGPEFVKGPANVTSREDTLRMIKGASGEGTGSGGNTYNTNEINVTIAVDNADGDIVEILEQKFKNGWIPITEDTDQGQLIGV